MSFSPEYRAYMKSDEWKKRRIRALHLANNRCQVCGEPGKLEVHHVTYERLGHEWDSDLLAVCKQCHRVITAWLRTRRAIRKFARYRRHR